MATITDRQGWMATLAKAPLAKLEQCMTALGELPAYGFLRSPEIGLAMVRGRAGGVGDAFNLGEITLTRCVVHLAELGEHATSAVSAESTEGLAEAGIGFGYVVGRSPRHAELAALCDALLQQGLWHHPVMSKVIEPLQQTMQQAIAQQQQQTAATQVEFFTLLRGE